MVKELGCPKPRLTQAGIEILQSYDWPGNVRELRNVIERAVIFARGGALEFDVSVSGFASNMGIEQSEIEAKHENQGASRRAVLSTSREPAIRERSAPEP